MENPPTAIEDLGAGATPIGVLQEVSRILRPEACEEELETCCVCLDSLSSGPCSALMLVDVGDGTCVRACSHYIHTDCASKLRPQKCPLCRTSFTQLSEPLDRHCLELPSEELLKGLQRLQGHIGNSGPSTDKVVPTRTVVELLAATLPVPEDALYQDLEAEDAERGHPGLIDAAGLGRVLMRLGMQSSNSQGRRQRPVVRYSLAQRICRRLRWLLLKGAGAAGVGLLCGSGGIISGVLLGGLAAVPHELIPKVEASEDGIVLLFKVSWIFCLIIYHGARNTHLLARGLKWGACVGVAFGSVHGLVTVNPEAHGLRSVFWAGITGRFFGRRRTSGEVMHKYVRVFKTEASE